MLKDILTNLGAGAETTGTWVPLIWTALAISCVTMLVELGLHFRANREDRHHANTGRIVFSYLWRIALVPFLALTLLDVGARLLDVMGWTHSFQHHYHQLFLANPRSWLGGLAGMAAVASHLWSLGILPLAVLLFWCIRRAERRVQISLLTIAALGAALRVFFAPRTLMGMSNYLREPNLIEMMERGATGFHALLPDNFDRFQEILYLNLAVSCALPLVFYAHASFALRKPQHALAATLLFAIAPIPIFFAASDAQFVTSMFFTCGALALLHGALSARTWYAEIFFGFGALNLFDLALGARQVNMVFGGVAVLACISFFAKRRHFAPARTIWATFLLMAALTVFTAQLADHGMGSDGGTVGFTERLSGLLALLGNPHHTLGEILIANFYLWPNVFPLPISLLACLGAWELFRRDRTLFLYVAGWFIAFYAAHCAVRSSNIIAASRYGFHTITPIFFTAAVGVFVFRDQLQQWKERFPERATVIRGAVGVFLVVTGVMGCGLFSLPQTDLQEEYAFLRDLSSQALPPSGAVVVEPAITYSLRKGHPGMGDRWKGWYEMQRAKRYAYFGVVVSGDTLIQRITVEESIPRGDRPTYLYLGLPCYWQREEESAMAQGCQSILNDHPWAVVDTYTITGTPHDVTNGRSAVGKTIGLYRLERKPSAR